MATNTNTSGNTDTHVNNLQATCNVDTEQTQRKWSVQKLSDGTIRFSLGSDNYTNPCIFVKPTSMEFQMIKCHCTGGNPKDRIKSRTAYKACKAEGTRRYNRWLLENDNEA